MGIVRILLWLGYSLLSCAGLMAVTAIMGYINFEARDATLLSVVAVVTALTGALMITGSFRASTKESAAEAILFLMLFWVIVPIVCSVPFYALGAVPNPIAAMFEGVSAITTTGASRLVPEELSRTLLFWRSLLQYFGGASTATFAVVILAALNLSGTGIHRSGLFTFRTGELFPRIIGIGRLIGAIYLFFALLAFMLMVAGGTGAFDAICLALSGVGTGGLAPQSGPLTNYLSPFSAIVLSILCLMGAMNISVFWDVIRTRHVRVAMRVFTHVEHRGLFVLILLMVIVTVVFASLYNLGSAIVDSIFFISTAAFRYDVVSLDMVPAPILITVALIGGSALSTAGGIKIIRLILLFRHLGTDLARLSHPSRLVPIQFKRSPVDDDSFLSVWMYFFGYVICFAGGALALAASGLTLEDSLASSAASLANMGPLLELTLPGSGLRYADYTSLQMVIATLLMLIGRVEVLIALSLLLPSTWRQ